MSLWKKSKSRELQSLVMVSIVAVSCFGFNMETEANRMVATGQGHMIGGDGTYYLYYCETDTTYNPGYGFSWDLKAGNYYVITRSSDPDEGGEHYTCSLVGPAGISDEKLQQAIEDAVHNVDGDQTVDGDQQVTGDQTVKSVA